MKKIAFGMFFLFMLNLLAACTQQPVIVQAPPNVEIKVEQNQPQAQPPVVVEKPIIIQQPPAPESKQQSAPNNPCAGLGQSQLAKGMYARVTLSPNLPNRLRTNPILDDKNIIGLINPGTRVYIYEGPFCGTYLFWYVRVEEGKLAGKYGYTAEKDSTYYFLEPQ